ncbi:MAG: LVIVD repeat-containing protein, partial [Actinomycetota bacterium]
AGPTDVAGVPAAQVGQHGPIADFLSGPLELVGHADMAPAGGGVPLGNNGAVALIDDCAYVGRWHDYEGANAIQIVDVSDPGAPAVIGGVPGSNVAGAVGREIRAIDLPSGFKLLTVLTFSKFTDQGILEAGLNALRFYTFDGGDCTKPVLVSTYQLRNFRPHEFFQWIDPNPAHDVDGHPRILEYVTTPIGVTDVVVVDASKLSKPKLIGLWVSGIPVLSPREENVTDGVPFGLGAYTHSISLSADGRRAYISQWDGGFFTMDTGDFARKALAPLFKPLGLASIPIPYPLSQLGNTHSAVVATGASSAVVGDEIYVTTDGCPYGWMRTFGLGSTTTLPKQIGEFRLAENQPANCTAAGLSASRNLDGMPIDGTFTMHNQTVAGTLVLTSWYGAGLRVIDVANPAKPLPVAAFVPKPLAEISSIPDTPAPVYGATETTADDWWVATWSYPVIRDGLIYVADIRNGLYILRPTPGSSLDAAIGDISFLEGNSNLGDFID